MTSKCVNQRSFILKVIVRNQIYTGLKVRGLGGEGLSPQLLAQSPSSGSSGVVDCGGNKGKG